MNNISTYEKYKEVIAILHSGDYVNGWSLKPYKNCLDVYKASEIADNWNQCLIKGTELDTFTIVNETLNYLLYVVLDEKIEYHKYRAILDTYTNSVFHMQGIEDAIEISISTLIKIGYIV